MVDRQILLAQRDVVWLDLDPPSGSGPAGHHPAVVVQSDRFNKSGIDTLVVVMITSQVRLGDRPGNVVLPVGTGGLTKLSVANVSQIYSVDREDVLRRSGKMPKPLFKQIWDGVTLVLAPPE